MKPFEDILPEEEGNDLVDLLQEEHPTPLDLTPTEQEQITQSVRQRLLQTPPDAATDKGYEPGQILMAPVSRLPATRRQRLVRLASSLVAVLVVGVIITSALLLFVPQRTIMTGPPAGPVMRAPAATHIQAGGFEMTLGITPGPYFISEMLEVNITLTNHTSKTQRVGVPFGNGCGYAPGLNIKEDLQPAFELPAMDHKCPAGAGQHFEVQPGQTLSAHKYFVLQWSGTITLTSYIEFDSNDSRLAQPTLNPLDGHWPTLHIQVASQVPQGRQLTAHVENTHITVDAPAQTNLQYLYGVSCTNGPGSGSEETGNYGWQPLKSSTVNRPACSMKHITWSYAIGAPGYAVASGNAKSDT